MRIISAVTGPLLSGAHALRTPDFMRTTPAHYGGRRTLYTYQQAQIRNRYTGKMLREIRKSGQARECARRVKRMAGAAQ